jgi:hypothetical protein
VSASDKRAGSTEHGVCGNRLPSNWGFRTDLLSPPETERQRLPTQERQKETRKGDQCKQVSLTLRRSEEQDNDPPG